MYSLYVQIMVKIGIVNFSSSPYEDIGLLSHSALQDSCEVKTFLCAMEGSFFLTSR